MQGMLKSAPRQVELLAPVRDLEQGQAAVLCGADALYVGAPRFGARVAVGVDERQIEALCRFAHRYRVRVYVTMNTLLYEQELKEAERMARRMWEVGADALIIQDMAFLRMDLPPIELHASTQMFNAEASRTAFLAGVGFSRVILERALTLEEIADIARHTDAEIEAFIHGAICVGYSGRCYMSRTMSARSGNRGYCAQLCRLPYNLLDEHFRPLMRDRHLLSVRDMNLSGHLEAMIDAGVTSFKIEGRLKDMSYVRNVVSWYRRELDEIIARRDDLVRSSQGESWREFEPDPTKSFSRGGTAYYLEGGRLADVASFDTPKSMGERLGKVVRVGRDRVELERPRSLSSGDGICFLSSDGSLIGTHVNRCEGGYLYPNRMEGLRPGVELYRNYDHRFVSAVERSRLKRVIPLRGVLRMEDNAVHLRLEEGSMAAEATISGHFEPARRAAQAEETLRTQLARMGDSIYRLDTLEIEASPIRFVPASKLSELRRAALAVLDRTRQEHYRRRERKTENRTLPFPDQQLLGSDNVTNSLAERFYRDHGVQVIEPGYDLRNDLRDQTVMRMRYCLRRELGWCLKEKPTYAGRLYLEHGGHVYELHFDCVRCGMELIYRGRQDRIEKR